MATVARPSTNLPDPGSDLEAEPIRDYINNILTMLEGNNIDDANVDFTSSDGIMAMRKAQTITGAKTHTASIILSGAGLIDLNGVANSLILDTDADTHISAPTDDQIDIAIGGSDRIVLATAGSTFSHPVTVGVNDTGHDVKFFGATAGKSWLWDESADTEILTGNSTISGTLGVTGVLTATAQSVHTGGLVSGSNIVSDADSTDDLGTTGVRWANLYVDAIVATDTIAATSYTGALLTAVTAVTQSDSNNSTKVATTAYVDSMVGDVTGTSLSGSTNNTITTVTGANALVGEANLTFDGNDLSIGGGTGSTYMDSVNGILVGVNTDLTNEITIATTNLGLGALNFTDLASTTNQAWVQFDHNTETLGFETVANTAWTTGGTERMRIDSNGRMGIANAAPSTYANAAAGLVVGDTGDATSEITIATTTSGTGELNFTDTADATNQAGVYFNHNDAGMRYHVNQGGNFHQFTCQGTNAFHIDANGAWYGSNETTNDNSTVGITFNQAGHDNEIFALKSTDVAHGRTSAAETDTWLSIQKASADLGGAQFNVLTEDGATGESLHFEVYGGTANTAKTTSAVGLVTFAMSEHDGANGAANITANGNIFAIKARVGSASVTRFLVDEDGDMYSATSGQTFDAHDDLALVNNYDVIRSDMADWNVEHEAELVRLGVLGDTVANGGMTNVTQLQRLHNGAIRQLGEQNNALQLELDEMKQQLFLLQERN